MDSWEEMRTELDESAQRRRNYNDYLILVNEIIQAMLFRMV